MLNYIMQYFVSFLVNYPLKEEGAISQTVEIADTAKLPLFLHSISFLPDFIGSFHCCSYDVYL